MARKINLVLFILIIEVALLVNACNGDDASPITIKLAKVVAVEQVDKYTYIKCSGYAKSEWLATPTINVNHGDIIQFGETEPIENFKSNGTGKTYSKIVFSPSIVVVTEQQFSSDVVNISHELADSKTADGLLRRHNALLALLDLPSAQAPSPDGNSAPNGDVAKNNSICILALVDINDAIELAPNNDEYVATRAKLKENFLCENLNDLRGVIQDYELATKLNPANASYVLSKGWAYSRLKDAESAEKCAQTYINIGKDKDRGYTLMAAVEQLRKNETKVIANYKKAMLINPDGIASFYADFYFTRNKKHAEAEKFYTEIIKVYSKKASLYVLRGKAFQSDNKHKKALSDFNVALQLNPNDADIYNGRADVYESLREISKAWQDYSTACRMGNASACEGKVRLDKDLARGLDWELLAVTTNNTFYINRSKIGANGKYKTVWIRSEVQDIEKYIKENNISDYEKKKYNDMSHELTKFDIRCGSNNMRTTGNFVYSSDGTVISTFENPKALESVVIPGTVGETIYNDVCKSSQKKNKK